MLQIFYKEKPIIISDKKSDLKNKELWTRGWRAKDAKETLPSM